MCLTLLTLTSKCMSAEVSTWGLFPKPMGKKKRQAVKRKEKCNKCKYPVPPLAALLLLALALLRACFFLKMLSCDREDFFNC